MSSKPPCGYCGKPVKQTLLALMLHKCRLSQRSDDSVKPAPSDQENAKEEAQR